MLTQAEIDYEMWIAMRNARAVSEVRVMINRRYSRFYLAAETALFNSLISILYAVFEKRTDTVNFWTLRKSLPENIDSDSEIYIAEKFASIKPIWKRICIIRNEVVGHQSMKRTANESHELAGVKIGELKEMITLCQQLLFYIASTFQDAHVVFNLKGSDTFTNLIDDLRSNNQINRPAGPTGRS